MLDLGPRRTVALMIITSVHNPRVKAAARLRDRWGRGAKRRTIIGGVGEISRAIAAGVEVVELYVFPELCGDEVHQRLLAAAGDIERLEVAPHVMEKLAFGHRVEGIVAVARPPARKLTDLKLPADALVA